MNLDFEKTEKLRNEYTGQLVTIDAKVPELARFAGRQGTVQTVTQMGLALVQFEGTDRTRYDIELDYLKVVDSPTRSSFSIGSEPTTGTGKGKELSRLEKARLERKCEVCKGTA